MWNNDRRTEAVEGRSEPWWPEIVHHLERLYTRSSTYIPCQMLKACSGCCSASFNQPPSTLPKYFPMKKFSKVLRIDAAVGLVALYHSYKNFLLDYCLVVVKENGSFASGTLCFWQGHPYLIGQWVQILRKCCSF